MTNLLEKALTIGFGLFMAISFIGIISPLSNFLITYEKNQEDFNQISETIVLVDQSIRYVSLYHNKTYKKPLLSSRDLNITIKDYQVKFIFEIDREYSYLFKYEIPLKNRFFSLRSQKSYILSISFIHFQIRINISSEFFLK